MRHVKQMQLRSGMSINELTAEMRAAGVLGAGRIGEAAKLTAEMFSNPDYTVFLTIAGALVPAGLRKIIRDLIAQEYVNVVVTTGANMVHDMVEALGHKHARGSFFVEDKKLKDKEIGRIGDIYIQQEVFQHLEKWLFQILETIPEEKREHVSVAELLFEIGKQIKR